MSTKILDDINSYYSNKIMKYGASPKGVDWKDEESQITRFNQLLKIVTVKDNYSLNDLGCGYGKLYGFMAANNYRGFSYIGYDLSMEMIKAAQKMLNAESEVCKFRQITSSKEMELADYTVASGIFNVKMQFGESEWLSYILETLEDINNHSKKSFSFNILTKYSDPEYMREDLYYADPVFFFDYCKRNFSRNIALLHDYNLYEFTILVKKV